MKKFLIWLVALAAAITYLAWVIEDRAVLMLIGFAVLALVVRVAALAAGIGAVSWVAWRFLRPQQRDYYSRHRVRFVLFVVAGLIFFVVVGFWLNRYALPHRLHPMSLVADGFVALYAIMLTWTLISPTRRKATMALPVTAVMALAVFAITALAPAAPDGGGGGTDAISTLGYLTWVPAEGGEENSGVVYHDSLKAYPGYNLYGPRNQARAYLMDNYGTIVHTWERAIEPGDNWNHIELLPNGDLIAIAGRQLICLDWDSNIRWIRLLRSHHDVAVADSGDVYALTRTDRMVRLHGFPVPILDDQVTILAPDGTTRETISLFDVMGELVPQSRLWRIYRECLNPRGIRWISQIRRDFPYWLAGSMVNDVFHTNTIEIIDRDIDDIFRRGHLIVNSRTQNSVCVIDPRSKKLLWSWGRGRLQWPHHPTLLDNGNLLIFDNGSQRHWTRIVELDPRSEEIVWEYTAENRRDFFSYTRGGNQRLPNGNTLITNSDSGHVFEVTSDGEIVWEFLNPEINEKQQARAAIYRLMRIYDRDAFPCLDRLADRS